MKRRIVHKIQNPGRVAECFAAYSDEWRVAIMLRGLHAVAGVREDMESQVKGKHDF
jgi:hypothetical protein